MDLKNLNSVHILGCHLRKWLNVYVLYFILINHMFYFRIQVLIILGFMNRLWISRSQFMKRLWNILALTWSQILQQMYDIFIIVLPFIIDAFSFIYLKSLTGYVICNKWNGISILHSYSDLIRIQLEIQSLDIPNYVIFFYFFVALI